MMRRAGLTGIAACAAMLVGPLATSAHASAYRYWTYWQGGADGWAFASAGPAFTAPADGSVEGWSFRVSAESGTADAAPSTPADFTTVCGTEVAPEGTKRIALVIEPGPPAIAPSGETPFAPIVTCVTAEADATGYDILRSVVEVRTEDGLVCALAGYPASECAPILDDAEVLALTGIEHGSAPTGLLLDTPGSAMNSATDAAAGAESSTPGSPVASLAVVALLAIGALQFVWLRRRRRQ